MSIIHNINNSYINISRSKSSYVDKYSISGNSFDIQDSEAIKAINDIGSYISNIWL